MKPWTMASLISKRLGISKVHINIKALGTVFALKLYCRKCGIKGIKTTVSMNSIQFLGKSNAIDLSNLKLYSFKQPLY